MSEHTEANDKPQAEEKPVKAQTPEKPVKSHKPVKSGKPDQPEQPEQHEHHPAKQSSGSSGSFIAILLALVAVIALFLLWQRQQAMSADAQALQQSVAKLLTVVEQRNERQMEQLSQLASHQHLATEAELERLTGRVQDLQGRFGRGEQGWFIAEMEYLLRTASHQLSLERDKQSALTALQQARQRMANKNLDIYQPVIQQIDTDIARISAIPLPDRNQIATEIGKLLAASEQWPFAVSTNHVAGAEAGTSDAPTVSGEPAQESRLSLLLDRVWKDLKGLVTIRRNGDVARPLLEPQQRYFLLQNMQLKLQAARLALHAGNDMAFRDSLIEAESWLNRYFDTSNLQVSEAQATLKQLVTLDLSPALPTLGDNLALLQRVAMQLLPPPQDNNQPPETPTPSSRAAPAETTPSEAQSESAPTATATPPKEPEGAATEKPPTDVPDQPTGNGQ